MSRSASLSDRPAAAPRARRALGHHGRHRNHRVWPALAHLALLLAGLTGCASSSRADTAPPPERAEPTLAAVAALDWTQTSEIRFSGELVGFLVEVLEVPEGVEDRRAYRPGTLLVQDLRFRPLGFISPGGTTYGYDEQGLARAVGFGGRNLAIANFFRRTGSPQIITVVEEARD